MPARSINSGDDRADVVRPGDWNHTDRQEALAGRKHRVKCAIVAERKSFLIRVDREVLESIQRWANDDLRSLNGQIEFLLRKALKESGRGKKER